MNDIISLIKSAEDFCATGPVELSSISEAENELGVTFSDDYKLYVLTFGAASFNGRELTGICNSNRLSVTAATARARNYFLEFPHNAYVIEEMLIDHIIIIQNPKGTIFSYGPSDEAMFISNTLKEYLFPETQN